MPGSAPVIPDSTLGGITRAMPDVAAKLEALSTPATYGPGTGVVTVIETHFAWVFLTEHSVYKLKKPIRAPDLDLDSLPKRFQNCGEELRLNRELSPEVYVGLASLVRGADDKLHLGGEGVVVDWLVQMHRLADEQMLDQAIAAGRVPAGAVERAAHFLAEFYRRQSPIEFTREAYTHRLQGQIETNRVELLAADLELAVLAVEELIATQRAALDKLQAEVGARAGQRRIIEVHGDLRPEHVCLGPAPAIIDRLEFSRDLRIMDPCEELAYFAVECRRAGAAWIGDRFLSIYRSATADPISDALFRLYQSHRATTRAKIVAWHLRDPAFKARQAWSAIAGSYLEQARNCLGE